MALLSPRQQQVLRVTVRHYIDTVEPVSSGALVQRFHLNASPATVRNAMVWLERQGLLRQPHTSAGRIPSQQGYRHYVDALLPHGGSQVQRLQRELNSLRLQVQWTALDDLLRVLAGRLADLTGLLALITRPTPPTPRLRTMRLVSSGERLVLKVGDLAGPVRER
ncbi:MAG TPA: HrcA family transcriptional regulator, partial [Synechococcus sp. UBA8638]|nr:HrcA family transcriptional regulator [Synechococcus sp. UBA8638]